MYNNTETEVIYTEQFTGINIGKIHIIAHKSEPPGFDFYNMSRKSDGFVFFTSGSGYAVTPDGNRQKIEKDDILLLNKNDRYELHFEGPCSYITSGYDIDFDENKSFCNHLPYVIRCSSNTVKKLFAICDIWQSRKWDSYSLSRINLIELYLTFIEKYLINPQNNTYISKAISYIHDNFKRNFSGDEIASFCSVSKSYLRSQFVCQTGMTVTEYRDNLRINTAKELLESKHFSITEIAAELGYCDIYHFSKAFKQITGTSPRTYIREKIT